jgi:hypothetical protein
MSKNTPWLTPRQQINAMRSFYAMQEAGGTAFLVCIDCGEKVEQYFVNLYWKEDEEIAVYFTRQGWTIKPTRCPNCASNKTKGVSNVSTA